jgi:hypothetical protein
MVFGVFRLGAIVEQVPECPNPSREIRFGATSGQPRRRIIDDPSTVLEKAWISLKSGTEQHPRCVLNEKTNGRSSLLFSRGWSTKSPFAADLYRPWFVRLDS